MASLLTFTKAAPGAALAPRQRPSPIASRRAAVAPRATLAGFIRHATPQDGFKFEPVRESQVSRAMTSRYFKDLHDHAEVSCRGGP